MKNLHKLKIMMLLLILIKKKNQQILPDLVLKNKMLSVMLKM